MLGLLFFEKNLLKILKMALKEILCISVYIVRGHKIPNPILFHIILSIRGPSKFIFQGGKNYEL